MIPRELSPKEKIESILLLMNKKMDEGKFTFKDYEVLRNLLVNKDTRATLFRFTNRKLKKAFHQTYAQSANYMAESFTAETISHFKNFDTREVYIKDFADKKKHPELSFVQLVDHYNDIANLVTNSILSIPSTKERTLLLEHWIHVAEACKNGEPPDAFTALAIFNGFNSIYVSKLTQTFQGLSKDAQKILNEMTDFFASPTSMKAFIAERPHAVPFIAQFSNNMTQLWEVKDEEVSIQSDYLAYKVTQDFLKRVSSLKQDEKRKTEGIYGHIKKMYKEELAKHYSNLDLIKDAEVIEKIKRLETNLLNPAEKVKPFTSLRKKIRAFYHKKEASQAHKEENKIESRSGEATHHIMKICLALTEKKSEYDPKVKQYAEWIYRNDKPKVDGVDPMLQDNYLKVLATTHLMFKSPQFFNPELSGTITQNKEAMVIAKNRVELAKMFLNDLADADKKAYELLLETEVIDKNNKDEKSITLLDALLANQDLPYDLKTSVLQVINSERIIPQDSAFRTKLDTAKEKYNEELQIKEKEVRERKTDLLVQKQQIQDLEEGAKLLAHLSQDMDSDFEMEDELYKNEDIMTEKDEDKEKNLDDQAKDFADLIYSQANDDNDYDDYDIKNLNEYKDAQQIKSLLNSIKDNDEKESNQQDEKMLHQEMMQPKKHAEDEKEEESQVIPNIEDENDVSNIPSYSFNSPRNDLILKGDAAKLLVKEAASFLHAVPSASSQAKQVYQVESEHPTHPFLNVPPLKQVRKEESHAVSDQAQYTKSYVTPLPLQLIHDIYQWFCKKNVIPFKADTQTKKLVIEFPNKATAQAFLSYLKKDELIKKDYPEITEPMQEKKLSDQDGRSREDKDRSRFS